MPGVVLMGVVQLESAAEIAGREGRAFPGMW